MVGDSTTSLGNLCQCLNIEEPQLFTLKKNGVGVGVGRNHEGLLEDWEMSVTFSSTFVRGAKFLNFNRI